MRVAITPLTALHKRGFSLVVTLLLMMLLAVVALGLLSLSSLTVRQTAQADARSMARANARVALALALDQLQKTVGPDKRITITADQRPGDEKGLTSAAVEGRRFWTGVYHSWDASVAQRPKPEFVSWLVSGKPERVAMEQEIADEGEAAELVQLVGAGTLGKDSVGTVSVPLISQTLTNGQQGRLGWWVGDQGTKAAIVTPTVEDGTDPAGIRHALQGSPRNGVELVTAPEGSKVFEKVTASTRTVGITDWKQAELLASPPVSARPLFHDLAAQSRGLLTNVRAGGFRKDLSCFLEGPLTPAMKAAPLYSAGGQAGINQGELWAYYHVYKQLKTGGTFPYTTGGGGIDPTTPYLQIEPTLSGFLNDSFALYKHPTVVSVKLILSFYGEPMAVGGKTKTALFMVMDPIITYWNPLDVPLVITPAYHSIKYTQLPYTLKIEKDSETITRSFQSIVGNANFLTCNIGKTKPVVLRPGEVVMFSQASSTSVTKYSAVLNFIEPVAGWNFGGGMALPIKNGSTQVTLDAGETFKYEVTPNNEQVGGSAIWFLTGNEAYYKEDRSSKGESHPLTSLITIDNKDVNAERLYATQFADLFGSIGPSEARPLSASQLNERKEPFMIFSYSAKTEQDCDRPGKFLARFNPRAGVDFQSLTADELDMLPYEIRMESLNGWTNRNFEVSPNGSTYFGGGSTGFAGVSSVVTHSIPRGPLYSLAGFQNAFANGFVWDSPSRPNYQHQGKYLLPPIAHAIGNSLAPSVMAPDETSSAMNGRPLADHSYLANQALWDDCFFSGIAPQQTSDFATKRTQRQVAEDFLKQSVPLPNSRYLPHVPGGVDPEQLISRWFSGQSPTAAAISEVAASLTVDGMFNVNSTSVQAWKAVLSGLYLKPLVAREPVGEESIVTSDGIPVIAHHGPRNLVADPESLNDVKTEAQWDGRRVLSDEEVETLAEAMVREVRIRGPFLSLADFINRRVGNDRALARAGAIQSALDSSTATINECYNSGPRAMTSASGANRGFGFPEAEEGASAYGIPGVVKQGDILTPIAPFISVRSDTFLIRAYGDCTDAAGNVLARAWCEAEVQRGHEFMDDADSPTTAEASLNSTNRLLGRRCRIVSFRWLTPSEI
jgi:hypothetical protein